MKNTYFYHVHPEYARHSPEGDGQPVLTLRTYQSGGIGNQLFWYASGMIISGRNHMAFILPKYLNIKKYYNLTEAIFVDEEEPGGQFAQVKEDRCCCYEKKLANPTVENVRYNAYLQSWKYFHSHHQLVRKQFQPQEHLKWTANVVLRSALIQKYGEKFLKHPNVLVGVHIRRGDMMDKVNSAYGFQVADSGYLHRAIEVFRRRYKMCTFVVCSNDIEWSQGQLANVSDVIFIQTYSPILDFTVLTLTNHTIMTTGTFSWWAAYLTGGDVVYYRSSSRPGSQLHVQLCSEDYFLPNWLPL